MYTNMSIVDAQRPHPYGDTLSPKRFGAVSSLDPEFFSRVDDFAGELLRGERSAKYSPAWVAASLESSAFAANYRHAGHACQACSMPLPRRRAADAEWRPKDSKAEAFLHQGR